MPVDDHESARAPEESADLLQQEVLGEDAEDSDEGGDVEDSTSTFTVDLDPEDQGTAEAAAANPD